MVKISLSIVPLVWLIDSLFAARREKLALHDMIVSTAVVREPAYEQRTSISWVAAAVALPVMAVSAVAIAMTFEDDYTELDRRFFVGDCTAGVESDTAYCECVYEEAEATIPYQDFVDDTPRSQRGISSASASCDSRFPAAE